MLDCEIVESSTKTVASIIWLHGLGADGHDFAPVVPQLNFNTSALRFIFPHAPMQAVTINNGYVMRAWYDIRRADILAEEDEQGIKASQQAIHALIEKEHALGIDYDRILLAGFSQGGAIALHTGLRFSHRLAGILALSTYLPLATTTDTERSPANDGLPIMMGHGNADPIVPFQAGVESRDLLIQLNYDVAWREYSMEHSVCAQEIIDVGAWLSQVLA